MKLYDIILEIDSYDFLDEKNSKPSYDFDLDYGTSISRQYDFPFGYTEDEVWSIYVRCMQSREQNGKYCKEIKRIVDGLNEKHFSYLGVGDLSFNVKLNIIRGMCSRFNVDDIIWFSINGIGGNTNHDVNKLIKRYFPERKLGLGWIPSPPTMNKILKTLGHI